MVFGLEVISIANEDSYLKGQIFFSSVYNLSKIFEIRVSNFGVNEVQATTNRVAPVVE